MADITIYHNPACGTSRKTLALIRDKGFEPQIIEYLQHPPTRERLCAWLARMDLPARALMRQKEALYGTLGLDGDGWTDAQLIDAMLAHPVLINRPVVVTPLGVRLCRPCETVLDILPVT